MVITAVLLAAVVTFYRTSIFVNRDTVNQANALNQLKNAYNYLSRDVQMASSINTTNDFLELGWKDYTTEDLLTVIYSIDSNGILTRNYSDYLYPTNNTTLDVASNVNTASNCVWNSTSRYLTVNITISKGPTNESKQFTLTPRAIQSSSQFATNISGVSLPASSTYGQAVSLTATVLPTVGSGTVKSGTVTFLDGGNIIGISPVVNGQATYSVSNLSVGGHTLTAVYSGDANYNQSTSPGWPQTVTKATLTVTATGPSKTYGTALTAGTSATNFSIAGLASGDTVTSVTLTPNAAGLSATTAAGTAYTVVPSAATGTYSLSNYNVNYVSFSGTVGQAALTITANNQSKTYGQTVTFGSGSTLFTSSGLQNGETIGSVTLACGGGAATATVASSPYAITPSAATGGTFTASNYTITYSTAGTLTVNPAALTVTANNQSKTYGQTVTFGSGSTQFTSSGLLNGNTIGSSNIDLQRRSSYVGSGRLYHHTQRGNRRHIHRL